ncbi:MAG: VOC family protein [Boseongicola sp.]|nr:VOC family protein [Boseongicola sp.]
MINVHGLEHVGLTVPDLEQAVEFFETVFGAVTVLSTGLVDVDDEFMIKSLGVPGDRRIQDIRVLRLGNGTNLELFQYSGEDRDAPLKRNSEPGACHLAFQVDDIEAAAARLREAGVDVLEGPTLIDSGPMEGLNWVYLRTPWGQFLELVSMDGPLGYEREGGPKAWSPVSSN